MKKIIIYIDMDDVLCNYSKARAKALELNPDIAYPQSQYGFFRKLEPLDGALESVAYLKSIAIFDVYILTAPSIYNPLSYSEKREWIENHLGMEMVKRLIISSNKGLNKGDYLIDDHISGRGQENFEGTFIHFGSPDFKDWKEVLYYFNNKYDLKK